jgi:hypothetical protein
MNFIRGVRPIPVIGMALLIIVVLNAALAWLGADFAQRHFTSRNFRFVEDSSLFARNILAVIREEKGRKVVVLGNSIIQGFSVKTNAETIPGFLERELNSISAAGLPTRVYNAGNNAMPLADAHWAVADLAGGEISLFIVNVLYPTFSRPAAERRYFGFTERDPERGVVAGVERWLSDGLYEHVALFRNKDYLSWRLFGRHPRETIKFVWADMANRWGGNIVFPEEERYRSWENNRAGYNAARVDYLRRIFAVGDVGGHVGLQQIEAICAEGKSQGAEVLFFTVPLNLDLIDEYDLMDWRAFDTFKSAVRRHARLGGGHFIDLTELIPSALFSDGWHMMSQGNKITGKALAEWIVEEGVL